MESLLRMADERGLWVRCMLGGTPRVRSGESAHEARDASLGCDCDHRCRVLECRASVAFVPVASRRPVRAGPAQRQRSAPRRGAGSGAAGAQGRQRRAPCGRAPAHRTRADTDRDGRGRRDAASLTPRALGLASRRPDPRPVASGHVLKETVAPISEGISWPARYDRILTYNNDRSSRALASRRRRRRRGPPRAISE